MITHFQVIPTKNGDRIYTLDDQGVLRVKQPQQMWHEIPGTDFLVENQTVETQYSRRHLQPAHSADEIFRPRQSILDGYVL